MNTMATNASEITSADTLMKRAALAGFQLIASETDTGQVVWEWCRGGEPRPQFVSERVARHWMFKWLEHQPPRSTRQAS
ncbi:MAG: hypothetical protein ACLPVY_07355 [Acidimicrobiia bacterium]